MTGDIVPEFPKGKRAIVGALITFALFCLLLSTAVRVANNRIRQLRERAYWEGWEAHAKLQQEHKPSVEIIP